MLFLSVLCKVTFEPVLLCDCRINCFNLLVCVGDWLVEIFTLRLIGDHIESLSIFLFITSFPSFFLCTKLGVFSIILNGTLLICKSGYALVFFLICLFNKSISFSCINLSISFFKFWCSIFNATSLNVAFFVALVKKFYFSILSLRF